MSVDMIWSIVLAGVLSQNRAIVGLLGVGAVTEGERSSRESLLSGLGAALVMVLSTLACWPLQTWLLGDLPFLRNMLLVPVILLMAWLVDFVMGRRKDVRDPAGFWKLAVSGAVLGLCLDMAALSFGEALITAAAAGIGFALAAAVFSKLKSRIDQDSVPAAFRGLPVELLCAGMIALALLAL